MEPWEILALFYAVIQQRIQHQMHVLRFQIYSLSHGKSDFLFGPATSFQMKQTIMTFVASVGLIKSVALAGCFPFWRITNPVDFNAMNM